MKKTPHHFHPQGGYVLLLVMLLIGTLGLYLTYQFGNQNIKNQSWQLQKTATEISYWMDIERNYIIDNGTPTPAALNNLSLPMIMSNNYLPYGQYRATVFKGITAQGDTLSQVSEFLCSPLSGVGANDDISAPTSPTSCPSGSAGAHCTLDSPPYYACANTLDSTGTEAIAKAQYYTNANYVAMGNNPTTLAGVGLMIRTPGTAQASNPSNSNAMGSLPNGSLAQSLIALLPNSYFNVFPSNTSTVNAIGIASYLSQPASSSSSGTSSSVIRNDRYSKIVDMGLVQASYGNPSGAPIACCGWSGDAKTSTMLYNGDTDKNGYYPQPLTTCSKDSLMKGTSGPPTCIKINLKKFGPSGTEGCKRVDVLYTPYDTAQKPNKDSTGAATWYTNYNPTWKTQDSDYYYLSLSAEKRFRYLGRTSVKYMFSDKQNMNTFFIYAVRCTRNPP